MKPAPIFPRFTIGDMLLATLLAALPLAFAQWVGLLAACCLSMMSLALTLGYGLAALVFVFVSLIAAANVETNLNGGQSPLSAFIMAIVLTLVIAIVLRFAPKRSA